MISYRVKTARDDLNARLTTAAAVKNRDSFVSAVYAALFDWIVNRINTIGQGGPAGGADSRLAGKFIGVLDIFGFEIFETNSFEQVLRLQHMHTRSPRARLSRYCDSNTCIHAYWREHVGMWAGMV